MMLLPITLLSGQEVHLNPFEIVALVQARDADDPGKHYTAEVRCVVQMTNGKDYTTREECSSVEKRLETLRKNVDDHGPAAGTRP